MALYAVGQYGTLILVLPSFSHFLVYSGKKKKKSLKSLKPHFVSYLFSRQIALYIPFLTTTLHTLLTLLRFSKDHINLFILEKLLSD